MDLEQRVERLEVEVAEMKTAISSNTAVTQSIKKDTEELIALLKGGKAMGKLIAWLAILTVGVKSIWETLKGWR